MMKKQTNEAGLEARSVVGDALSESLRFEIRNLGEVVAGQPSDRFDRAVYLSRAATRNRLLIQISTVRKVNLQGFAFRPILAMLTLDPVGDEKLKIVMPAGWKKEFTPQGIWQFEAPENLRECEAGKHFSFIVEGFSAASDAPAEMRYLLITFTTASLGNWRQDRVVPVFVPPGDGGKLIRGVVDAGSALLTGETYNVTQNKDELWAPYKQRNDLFTNSQGGISIVNRLGLFVGNIQPKAIPKRADSALYIAIGWWMNMRGLPQLVLVGESKSKWSVEEIRTESGLSYWRITPLGANFFDKDEIVSLRFEGICLDDQQGPSSFLVGYAGLPGGDFGCLSCPVNRVEPAPTILATNQPIILNGISSENVKCEWDTFGGKVTTTTHIQGLSNRYDEKSRKGSMTATLNEGHTRATGRTTVVNVKVTNSSSGRSTERVLASYEDLRELGWGNRFGVYSEMKAEEFEKVHLIITQNQWWIRARKNGELYEAAYSISSWPGPTLVSVPGGGKEIKSYVGFKDDHPYRPTTMSLYTSGDKNSYRLDTPSILEAWRKARLVAGDGAIAEITMEWAQNTLPLTLIDSLPPI